MRIVTLNANNPGPMTGSGNHTYLVVGGRGSAVLIDSGVGDREHLAVLSSALQEHGARLGRVLVTHAHGDHASGAAAIAAGYEGTRFFKYPWPEADGAYAVPWEPLENGSAIAVDADTLIAIHTPGHSPDHLAFWHESTRTAFTGDLVVKGSSVMIESSRGGDLTEYLSSLERILGLDAARLFPAHGPEIVEPTRVLTTHLEHRRMRERQVVAALAAGRTTVQAIAESIYDGLSPALLPAAHENVRAHLEKLRREGRASVTDTRWTL